MKPLFVKGSKDRQTKKSYEPRDPADKCYQPVELSIDGGPLDEKIDIYVLGGILYSLLASTRPYRNDTNHLIHKKAGILPTFSSNLKNDTTTAALWNAAKQCMAHDPRLRPTARQVVKDLELAYRQQMQWVPLSA
jgi:serine/threonine protein kinase